MDTDSRDVTKFTLYDEVLLAKLKRAIEQCEARDVNESHLAELLGDLYVRLAEINLALRKIDSCSTTNILTGIFTVQAIITVLKTPRKRGGL